MLGDARWRVTQQQLECSPQKGSPQDYGFAHACGIPLNAPSRFAAGALGPSILAMGVVPEIVGLLREDQSADMEEEVASGGLKSWCKLLAKLTSDIPGLFTASAPFVAAQRT